MVHSPHLQEHMHFNPYIYAHANQPAYAEKVHEQHICNIYIFHLTKSTNNGNEQGHDSPRAIPLYQVAAGNLIISHMQAFPLIVPTGWQNKGSKSQTAPGHIRFGFWASSTSSID